MFGKSTEKRVAREADKIVSLKEDMDALSWTRVLEIGKQLQEGVEEADRIALARELVSIAQSNRSLYTRLGIDPASSPSRVMASGIEVMEGGLAEAAIEEQVEHSGQVDRKTLSAANEQPATEPIELPEPRVNVPVVEVHHAYEPSEIDFQAAEVQAECDLVARNDPDEDDFIEAAQAVASEDVESVSDAVAEAVVDLEPEPESERKELAEPVTLEQLLAATEVLEEAVDELAAAAATLDESDESEAADDPTEPMEPIAAEPASEQESAPAPEPVSEPQRAPGFELQPAPEPAPESEAASRPAKKRRFARFRNLYESRDGGLCVFEDEHGHLVAVDSSKLA